MLQLILGRAGYGKTEYVFSSIKQLVEQGNKNILLITPEQYSFISERRLLNDLGEENNSCVINTSFSRLSNEITREYGNYDYPILSKGSKAVLFKKACELCKEELRLFQKNVGNNDFINSAIKIYDEMKSCRVSSFDIMQASKNTDNELLSQKLHDIAVIMDAYDLLIKDKYIDSANELTSLYNKLIDADYFSGKTVFIDGFTGFVAQEFKIIEIILKQARMVYITFCSDSLINNDKYDLFCYVNKNIAILQDVAQKCGVKVLDPIFKTENKRANNIELKNVEKYAFDDRKVPNENIPSNINIYSGNSLVDECNYVSSQILKLLRNGVKASKIAVICRDMEKYQRELEFSFSKYNIPYFYDERQNISSQPLIMFVSYLLKIAQHSYRYEDIFPMLKTGLTGLDNDSINSLENYCYMWNINGKKFTQEFVQSPNGLSDSLSNEDKNELDEINISRDYVVSRIEKFIRSSKNKSLKDISKSIYYTLIDFGVDKGVTNLAIFLDKNGKSVLAKEQGRVWDLLMDILDKLANISNDDVVSIKEYSRIFSLMIQNEDLGSIPAGLDNVQFGCADRIRCNNPYATFVVGANDGVFPQKVSSAGLLTENDRALLIENDFKLYSYGEILNAQEKYFAYMALSSSSDKLFVSYCKSNEDESESIIVSNLQDLYPNINVTSSNDEVTIDDLETDNNAFEILAFNYEKNNKYISTLKSYFASKDDYRNRLDAIEKLVSNDDIRLNDSSLAMSMFKKNMYLSASRVDDYYHCAFRYFCRYGLYTKPRKKAELDPIQTGLVIHYILEKLIQDIGSSNLSRYSDAQIKIAVDKYLIEYFNEKLGTTTEFSKRFKYQFLRLSKMVVCVVARLRDEFSISDFEAKAFELSIGDSDDDNEVKSKEIKLPDGGTIKIKGSIDRVDTYEENGETFVRVVDYKTGIKNFHLYDILYGINLQMFIYLFSLCESEHKLSGTEAGVLYLHSARGIYNLDNRANTDVISSKNNENFKMSGIILNDEEHNMVEHMDRENSKKYLPAKINSKGIVTGDIVSLEDLGRLSRKIDSLIVQMGVNLHAGNINPNPISGKHFDKTCDNCDYKEVCVNRLEVTPNEAVELSFQEVLDLLKEEEENA